ncbi:uncharacterized protein MYCFIDRAFT_180478 [Pseudocercospora fijiensis CIRAD86]|uniref:Uncharacterized protein n=1 Tax=Pseudocercospora fijiensis (strain CIRAD86) TaxID=383855 RepID=M2ZD01_PSEFD|nr:uncharacterized protein MYCFIDRAFT_180478 [Pseudocercospora fijiensis CIRAD86]EME76994.1 hypothetical protein MYCFIDRAFT_180478 [Pseudocercospora fijiensis CIRAD86]
MYASCVDDSSVREEVVSKAVDAEALSNGAATVLRLLAFDSSLAASQHDLTCYQPHVMMEGMRSSSSCAYTFSPSLRRPSGKKFSRPFHFEALLPKISYPNALEAEDTPMDALMAEAHPNVDDDQAIGDIEMSPINQDNPSSDREYLSSRMKHFIAYRRNYDDVELTAFDQHCMDSIEDESAVPQLHAPLKSSSFAGLLPEFEHDMHSIEEALNAVDYEGRPAKITGLDYAGIRRKCFLKTEHGHDTGARLSTPSQQGLRNHEERQNGPDVANYLCRVPRRLWSSGRRCFGIKSAKKMVDEAFRAAKSPTLQDRETIRRAPSVQPCNYYTSCRGSMSNSISATSQAFGMLAYEFGLITVLLDMLAVASHSMLKIGSRQWNHLSHPARVSTLGVLEVVHISRREDVWCLLHDGSQACSGPVTAICGPSLADVLIELQEHKSAMAECFICRARLVSVPDTLYLAVIEPVAHHRASSSIDTYYANIASKNDSR